MTDLTDPNVQQAAAALAAGNITSRALTQAYLDRIAARDGDVNAYITVTAETALAQADESDARSERLGPLDGVPIALKDNIDVAGVTTTNGMGPRNRPVPETDAPVVERLRAAGAVVLGKLNMHEGALGATTDNEHHGRTQNPWARGVTPGGSSGGSSAAVAARLCAAALGTDTMGSVRLPAAYCGVAGLKPTFGLVSTRGVAALSWRLDHVGPLCRSVADLGLMLDAMAGHDPNSIESVRAPDDGSYAVDAPHNLAGVRVGVIANFDTVEISADVLHGFQAALAQLESMGAQEQRLTLPDYDPSVARRAGLLVSEAEAAVFHESDLADHPAAFSDTFRSMLAYGRDVKGDRLIKAERAVQHAGFALRRAFDEVDVIAAPTTPQTAFPFAQAAPANQADLTAPANFAGCPAVSVPCGVSATGLPLGLQLIGPPFGERQLLGLAMAFEAASGYHLPPLPADDF